MKDWKRTLAALLAAIMLVMPFTATAELALEPDALPKADGGMELEIAPESIGDAPDMELELPDAPELDGLGIGSIDLDAATIENIVIDGTEAEAANPVLSNDDDYDDDDDDDYDSDFEIDENGVLVRYRGDDFDVVIPDGVTSIGAGAFADLKSLDSVTIPDSVTSIGAEAFWSCGLNSITIPGSVTSIGHHAFWDCDSLTSITIPGSVTSIGEAAFCTCRRLMAINVSSNNPSYTSRNGVLYTRDMKTLLQGPGAITTVIIPYGVTSIEAYAFGDCENLTSVTIPASVTTIEAWAFGDCKSLTSVTIPASVTTIENYAFWGCKSLTSVTILAKSIDIAEDAFKYSYPTFHIVEDSDVAFWPWLHGYDGYTFVEGLSQKSLILDIGETHKLTVCVQGKLTTDVAWSSSNAAIATVKNGTVTAVKAGKCTITAKVTNGKALKCALTVRDPAVLSVTKLALIVGKTYKLKVYCIGNRTVTWSSSNKKVATVKAGTVTAVKAGKRTITAKVKNGKTLKCIVTVRDVAKLNKRKLSMEPGDSQTLKISGLNNRKVTWSSSDKKVATVKDGKITAVSNGRCTITAQIKNGKKLTCKVVVTNKPLALSNDKLTISSIDTDRIALTGGLNRKVTWSTSNKNVVEITKSDNGSASIKAVKNGSATITAKVEGGKTLKCEVTVVDPLTITVDEIVEESIYNKVWVYFNNHSNKKITYVTLDIAQYNNRGDKLESPYSYFYLNDSVAPHDDLHHYYWVNDDTKKVKIKITEVTFADKTTWKP